MALMIRNAATPARTTRMTMPAPRALPAKTRSPRLRTGPFCWVSSVAVAVTLIRPSDVRLLCVGSGRPNGPGRRSVPGRAAGGRSSAPDLGDDLLRLAAQVGRERRGAGGLRRGGLTVGADHVALERLEDVGLGRVLRLDAADV